MLYGYKKISIIYGGVGSFYASEIEKALKNLHQSEHYPIKVDCINTDWVSHNVLRDVISAIKDSDLIYIVFTLDDIGSRKSDFEKSGDSALKPRLRQNVLIELGMALAVTDMNIDRIKVIANFDKNALGDDFPSDIRDALAIRAFSDDKFSEVLISICEYVKSEFSLPQTKEVLKDESVVIDFENVLKEYDKYEFNPTKRIRTLKDIMSHWRETLDGFDFIEEKFVFALERLKAFPIFGNGKSLVDWIRNFQSALKIDKVELSERKFFKMIKRIIDLCLEYTVIKSDDDTENDFSAYSFVASEFEELYEQVKDYLLTGGNINPVALFCLYEYYGLTEMRLFRVEPSRERIEKIISLYSEGVDIAESVDSEFNLYSGYITFNLGRAYFYRYELTGDKNDLAKFRRFMDKTLVIRKKWKEASDFPECFINALSYEYFYAKSEYVKMLYKVSVYSKDNVIAEADKIIDGIDGYISKDAELSKLFKIKSVCVNLKDL